MNRMNGFSVLATNHTSFTVSNLDRSISFFQGVLSFKLVDRSPRDADFTERVVGVPGADIEVAYLQAPGHRIELIQYLAPKDRKTLDSRPCDAGFAHIAFDVDNIDAAVAAAQRVDVRPCGPPQLLDAGPNKGGKVVYVRNPDGVTVEFIEKPRVLSR
jgi:catechol 2,3-dioxygenase-like lactoylglutathione lyase family enzyme